MLGGKRVVSNTFFNQPVELETFDDVVRLYEQFQREFIEHSKEKFGWVNKTIEPDPFIDWLTKKSGICPNGLISSQSKEWWSYISALDGEMGLTLPAPDISKISNVFWEVLAIIREERALAREEQDGKKDSNNNNG